MARALSSTPALWRLPFGHFSETDPKNRQLREKIIARDRGQCSDCGLTLPRHMEVRHLDDDHDNPAETNLTCVCPFCHLRDHLGPTGFASAGLVIGSPTLTQGQVNTLALSIWYIQARINKTQDIRNLPDESQTETEEGGRQRMLSTATTLWNDLTTKSTRWTGAYSPLISEPDILGGVLNDLSLNAPETYAQRGVSLSGLHILPLKEAFETQCADWFKDFDKNRPLASWEKGLDALMARLETNPDDFYQEVRAKIRAATRSTPEALGRPMGTQAPGTGAQGDANPPPNPRFGKKYES